MKRSQENFIFVILIFFFIVCMAKISEDGNTLTTLQNVGIVALGIIPMGLIILIKIRRAVKKGADKREAIRMQNEMIQSENNMIENLKNGLPVLNIPNLVLGDAQLHLYQPAVLVTTETRMLGMENESSEFIQETNWGGQSMYKKWINPDIGEYRGKTVGTSTAVYGDVSDSFDGQMALTNKSVLFIHQQKGFELKINELSFVQEFSNGVSFQSEDKVYTVLLEMPRFFMAALNIVRNNNRS